MGIGEGKKKVAPLSSWPPSWVAHTFVNVETWQTSGPPRSMIPLANPPPDQVVHIIPIVDDQRLLINKKQCNYKLIIYS